MRKRVSARVHVCLVSPSALTLFEWLVIGACHIWLLHIKCVLMRDDTQPFFISSRTSVTISLCRHCCLLPIFLLSPSLRFILRRFVLLSLSLSPLFFNFICLRACMVRLLLWCEHNLRYDDKTIWIMFIPLQLVVVCTLYHIFLFHLTEQFFSCCSSSFSSSEKCVSVWASLFAWIFTNITHIKNVFWSITDNISLCCFAFGLATFWKIACLARWLVVNMCVQCECVLIHFQFVLQNFLLFCRCQSYCLSTNI